MNDLELEAFFAKFTSTWGRRWDTTTKTEWARRLRDHDRTSVRAAFDNAAMAEPEGPNLARFLEYVRIEHNRRDPPTTEHPDRRQLGCTCPGNNHTDACRNTFTRGLANARAALK